MAPTDLQNAVFQHMRKEAGAYRAPDMVEAWHTTILALYGADLLTSADMVYLFNLYK